MCNGDRHEQWQTRDVYLNTCPFRNTKCGSLAPGDSGAVGSQWGPLLTINSLEQQYFLLTQPKKKFTAKCAAKLLDKSIPSIQYMNTGLHQLRKPILVLLSVVGNQEEELLPVHDSTTTSSV